MNKRCFWSFVALVSLSFLTDRLLPEGLFVRALTGSAGAHVYLGDSFQRDGYCCRWGAKNDCQNDNKFACAASPVYCNPEDSVDGVCESASCLEDNRSGAKCRLVSFTPTMINCYATGATKTDGCPAGQEKCEFTEMQVINPEARWRGDTGTTMCTAQPLVRCL